MNDDVPAKPTGRLSGPLDSVGDLVLVFDRHRRLQRWNHVLAETTGRADEALASTAAAALFDDPDVVEAAVVDAFDDGRAAFAATVRSVDDDGVRYEFEATRYDGDAGGDSDGTIASTDSVVAVGRERRLPESDVDADQYEVILDSLTDAVYAIEPDGTFVYVNDRYTEMKGVSREELLSTNVDDWVTEETVAQAEEMRSLLASGERRVASVEYEFLGADGERFPAELRFGRVDRNDTVIGRVGTIRDVTTRVEREQALQRQNERLDEFASIVSHDLRNPLNIAEGRLELAREECSSDQLDAVDDALERMRSLVDDILTLAREGGTETTPEAVSLAGLVRPCWHSTAPSAATLVVETDATVRADERQLRRLLENLFRNCVEHGSGSSEPDVAADGDGDAEDDGRDEGAVTVTVGDLEDGFFVADDGPGIPPEKREDVFEAGYSTAPEGTGFGLRIVQEVADAHGWRVSVVDADETDAGTGGARFEVRGVTTVSSTDVAPT